MNILFINYTDGKGGAARLTMSLKNGLNKAGHHTSLFVKNKYTDNHDIFLMKKPNKILLALSKITKKDIGSILYNKFYKLMSNDLEFFNNKNFLKSEQLQKADIIHCHNLHHNYFNLKLLKKISKEKPVFWSLHDMWALTPHEAWIIKDELNNIKFQMEVKPRLIWNNRKHLIKAKEKIYKNSDLQIISTSNWFLHEAANSILKNQKHHLIYNGINENIYKPFDKQKIRKKLGLPKDKKIITFMASGGRLNKQKGWRYAQEVIENYKKNNNILFVCVGSTIKDSKLRNNNIRYIDYINNEVELAMYHSASDIFLNPSEAEAFCLILIQAMSCGVPSVTFPTGVAKDAIDHKKNGYLATYQNGQDLINGINYILNLTKKQKKIMDELSRQKVREKFTLNKMIENHINLYKQILNSKK